MAKSNINIDVVLDDDRMVDSIEWRASDSTIQNAQKAKAMMLSFWDNADKTALRIDLWTKDMMVDEMADFFYQMMMGMADTFNRATHQQGMTDDMKKFARSFFEQFRQIQIKENK